MFSSIPLIYTVLFSTCVADIVDVAQDGHFVARHSIAPIHPHKVSSDIHYAKSIIATALKNHSGSVTPAKPVAAFHNVTQDHVESDARGARVMLGYLVITSVLIAIAQLFSHHQSRTLSPSGEQKSAPTVVQTAHLDGVLFPTIAWIVAIHYGARHDIDESPWQYFIVNCRWTVTFFFILAGFATHCSWREEYSWAPCSLHRLAQLGLAYYGALLVWIFVKAGPCWALRGASLDPMDIVLSVLMLQTWPINGSHQFNINGPSWFIASAAFCWLTYPMWRGVVSRMNVRDLLRSAAVAMFTVPCIFLSVAVVAWTFAGDLKMPHATVQWLYSWPPVCLMEFTLGCLLCQLVQHVGQLRPLTNDKLVVTEEAFTIHAGSFPGLGRLCDATFVVIVVYIALAGFSASNCGSWGEGSCATGWLASQCISPVLASAWILLTSLPRTMGDPGLAVKLLSSKVLTSKVLVRPTLAMLLLQDALATLLARASLLPSQLQMHPIGRLGSLSHSPCYLAVLVLITWLVASLWSSSFEILTWIKLVHSHSREEPDAHSV